MLAHTSLRTKYYFNAHVLIILWFSTRFGVLLIQSSFYYRNNKLHSLFFYFCILIVCTQPVQRHTTSMKNNYKRNQCLRLFFYLMFMLFLIAYMSIRT